MFCFCYIWQLYLLFIFLAYTSVKKKERVCEWPIKKGHEVHELNFKHSSRESLLTLHPVFFTPILMRTVAGYQHMRKME